MPKSLISLQLNEGITQNIGLVRREYKRSRHIHCAATHWFVGYHSDQTMIYWSGFHGWVKDLGVQ